MNLQECKSRIRMAANRGRAWLTASNHGSADYAHRMQAEEKFFSGCQTAHELPDIFHYWSNKYLRPKLEQFGFSHPEAMYSHYFAQAYDASVSEQRTFASIGSGNCMTEVRLAKELIRRGHSEFVIQCIELNAGLLDHGRELAKLEGISRHIVPVRADFNKWSPTATYDGVLANNALHHVVNLEGLLGAIKRNLAPTGSFVTSDMIGRNGHMRWPEALSIVQEYWRELPRQYTYNHLLQRYEKLYENWDCSVDNFEGVRAQDILPLLIDIFDFDCFVPFGNVIDPFIERTFGPNFDASNAWDAAFIDRVNARDEAEITRGAIKPTHVLAALCVGRPGKNLYADGLSPKFCVRAPGTPPVAIRPRLTERIKQAQVAIHGDSEAPAASNRFAAANTATRGPTPLVDYTDLWWNPEESGWGISIHQHKNHRLVAVWFVYDPDGRPIWYSLQPGDWTGPSTYAGLLYATTGPYVDAAFSSRPVATTLVGTGVLDFVDPSNGTLSYALEGRSGQKTICRMSY